MALIESIKKIDIFGKKITFRFHDQDIFKTYCGAAATLLLFSILIIFIVTKTLEISKGELETINYTPRNTQRIRKFDKYGLTQFNEEIIGIGFDDSVLDSSVLKLEFGFQNSKTKKFEKTDQYFPCDEEIKSNLLPGYKRESHSGLRIICFSSDFSKVKEGYKPVIRVKKCRNNTRYQNSDQFRSCESKEVIDKKLKTFNLWVFASSDHSNFYMKTTHSNRKYVGIRISGSKDFEKEVRLVYREAKIKEKRGLFVQKNYYSRTNFFQSFSDHVVSLNPNSSLLRITMDVDQIKEVYIEKQYKSALDVLAFLGGFSKGLTILLLVIVFPVREILFTKKLINHMFNICLNEDQIDAAVEMMYYRNEEKIQEDNSDTKGSDEKGGGESYQRRVTRIMTVKPEKRRNQGLMEGMVREQALQQKEVLEGMYYLTSKMGESMKRDYFNMEASGILNSQKAFLNFKKGKMIELNDRDIGILENGWFRPAIDEWVERAKAKVRGRKKKKKGLKEMDTFGRRHRVRKETGLDVIPEKEMSNYLKSGELTFSDEADFYKKTRNADMYKIVKKSPKCNSEIEEKIIVRKKKKTVTFGSPNVFKDKKTRIKLVSKPIQPICYPSEELEEDEEEDLSIKKKSNFFPIKNNLSPHRTPDRSQIMDRFKKRGQSYDHSIIKRARNFNNQSKFKSDKKIKKRAKFSLRNSPIEERNKFRNFKDAFKRRKTQSKKEIILNYEKFSSNFVNISNKNRLATTKSNKNILKNKKRKSILDLIRPSISRSRNKNPNMAGGGFQHQEISIPEVNSSREDSHDEIDLVTTRGLIHRENEEELKNNLLRRSSIVKDFRSSIDKAIVNDKNEPGYRRREEKKKSRFKDYYGSIQKFQTVRSKHFSSIEERAKSRFQSKDDSFEDGSHGFLSFIGSQIKKIKNMFGNWEDGEKKIPISEKRILDEIEKNKKIFEKSQKLKFYTNPFDYFRLLFPPGVFSNSKKEIFVQVNVLFFF